MKEDTEFKGDDLRNIDPKFKMPRYAHYLEAVTALDELAKEYDHRVIHLAVRWILDRTKSANGIALWGARKPEQLAPVDEAINFHLDGTVMESVERILKRTINDGIGPEFMAPANRERIG
jgi:aryl-alcohol dehydrogenase-like predicted oxidoreductase